MIKEIEELLEKLEENKNYLRVKLRYKQYYIVVLRESNVFYYHLSLIHKIKRIKFKPGSKLYNKIISSSASYEVSPVNKKEIAIRLGLRSTTFTKVELTDFGYF